LVFYTYRRKTCEIHTPAWLHAKLAWREIERASTPTSKSPNWDVDSRKRSQSLMHAQKKNFNEEVDIPKAGMLTQGAHLALNCHSAQKKNSEPAAAMMADNEGKNIAMAASVA
jgi:hypothetical protein